MAAHTFDIYIELLIMSRRQVRRLLAGIYGENPGAVRFWERLGYHFAVDARPVLAWYAKELVASELEATR